jgi:hypothetical protein
MTLRTEVKERDYDKVCTRCWLTPIIFGVGLCFLCRSAEQHAKILDTELETPTGRGRYSYGSGTRD